MSILRLLARGESKPTPKGPRLSMHCKTSRGEAWGESGTYYQYQSPDRLLAGSCSWRPHTFARAKKRSWPNANNEVPHASVSSLLAFVHSRHATGGERVCCVTRPNNLALKETTASVAPMQFIFAYNYHDNKDIDCKRPMPEFIWNELKGLFFALH